MDRLVTNKEPLCDGTPRRSRGYKVRLSIRTGGRTVVFKSDDVLKAQDADNWYPSVYAISAVWGFAP